MERITRDVRNLENHERRALESVVGHALRENQRVVIEVLTLGEGEGEPRATAGGGLPEWCNVYEGLSDNEIAEVEKVILRRADLSRSW